jgi:hypothetical protein
MDSGLAAEYYIPNQPLGTPKGLAPGRVVWVHDPAAVDWDQSDFIFENTNVDPGLVYNMLSQGLKSYTGQASLYNAWDEVFKNYNSTQGAGTVGYSSTESIVIKANFTTCNALLGSCDPDNDYLKTNYVNKADTSPQLLYAIIDQLVNVVGVPENKIYVGDTITYFPKQWYDYLHDGYDASHTGFSNVNYFAIEAGSGRIAAVKATASDAAINWSGSTSEPAEKVAQFYYDASYIINAAVLKGHGGGGITACGKNHYGSLARTPIDGSYYNLHSSLPFPAEGVPGKGKYRALVDLMGHKDIGQKTLLCIVDGLYGGYYWEGTAYKWTLPPFGNGVDTEDWPSSLFLSMDQVAIDSVCLDFLKTEWPDVISGGSGAAGSLEGGAEDYLHEAAQGDNPISGTVYSPDNNGRISSLGVHEHWNNPDDKLYTRNLGTGSGIELVKAGPANQAPIVEAGNNKYILIESQTPYQLNGYVNDDYQGSAGACTIQWTYTLDSGPAGGQAVFDDDSDPRTTVTFTSAGVYTLTLSADDGDCVTTDSVTLTVRAGADFDTDGAVETDDFSKSAKAWLSCTEPDGSGCEDLSQDTGPVPGDYEIAYGTATVDGNISEWSGAQWIDLDYPYYNTAPDVSNAQFALRWGDNNIIYAAVKVDDSDHNFAGSYIGWNMHDHIEVYSQGSALGGGYSSPYEDAQQYIVGANGSGGQWAVFGDGSSVPTSVMERAVTVDGDMIYYEIAVKMYNTYPGTEIELAGGTEIGFDVIASSKYSGGFGMLSENDMGSKHNNASMFAHYTLLEKPVQMTIPQGSCVVDGDPSEWDSVPSEEWILLDKIYYGTPSDVPNYQTGGAKFAVRWDGNTDKIYCCVKVQDTDHLFEDWQPSGWNTSDRVEFNTSGGASDISYYGNPAAGGTGCHDYAQEYVVGPNLTGGHWTCFGGDIDIRDEAEFESATSVDGQWIIYEVGIKQFDHYAGNCGGDNVVTQLEPGVTVGFDVTPVTAYGPGGDGYSSQLAENNMPQKHIHASSFQQYTLVAGGCGDWGYQNEDLNKDCIVDLADVAWVAFSWLDNPLPLPDDVPPSVPTGITVDSTTVSTVNLSWNPSTDNVGMGGYYVYRDSSQIRDVAHPEVTFYDEGLNPDTYYDYTVAAYDENGNVSAQSSPATTAHTQPMSNYLQNPGFENDTLLPHWALIHDTSAGNGDSDNAKDSSTKRSGTYSMKVWGNSATGDYIEQHLNESKHPYNLEPNTSYTLRGYAKSQPGGSGSLRLRYVCFGDYYQVLQSSSVSSETSWTPMEINFTTPPSMDGIRIDIHFSTYSGKTFWVDDMSITEN